MEISYIELITVGIAIIPIVMCFLLLNRLLVLQEAIRDLNMELKSIDKHNERLRHQDYRDTLKNFHEKMINRSAIRTFEEMMSDLGVKIRR